MVFRCLTVKQTKKSENFMIFRCLTIKKAMIDSPAALTVAFSPSHHFILISASLNILKNGGIYDHLGINCFICTCHNNDDRIYVSL